MSYTAEGKSGGKASVFKHDAMTWNVAWIGIAVKCIAHNTTCARITRKGGNRAIRHDTTFRNGLYDIVNNRKEVGTFIFHVLL